MHEGLQSGGAFQSGAPLIEEIETTLATSPTLWWLGRSGFVIRFANMTFYVDPVLSEPLLDPSAIHHADLILCSHAHPGHMDGATLTAMLAASPRAKVVMPKSAAEHARSLGIPFHRMTTTDSDLRVEFFKDGLYGRVYAVPSAHPELNYTPIGGYPQLGYLIRFERWTIYHAGDSVPYEGLAERLKPYNVNVALLPIAGKANFTIQQAAQLAGDIGAAWIVPMHYGTGDDSRFVAHLLGQRPEQAFKVFRVGEKWTVPVE
ncbi:MAG: MBL fold metallo-hydrolase [Bryobacteraceae bacterium]